ncbi:MAG: nitrous oxide reductase accessory protein NosL [Gemmatimonadota bacterium]|jgi:nitrous oxide reductase accessory protein NosL
MTKSGGAWITILLLIAAGGLFAAFRVAHQGAPAARTGAAAGEAPRSAASSICPVCGMVVPPDSPWTATVVHEAGDRRLFDGPKDLFKYLLFPDRYPRPERGAGIGEITVTAYYDRATIPARAALFVVGSDVMGPMGAELIPHRTRAEAEEFAADHGGERIFAYDEVTPEILAPLR